MNKKAVEGILTEEVSTEFFRLLYRNELLQQCILKILDSKIENLSKPSPPSELTDSSWALRRAYQDGGRYNLESIRKVFEEQKK